MIIFLYYGPDFLGVEKLKANSVACHHIFNVFELFCVRFRRGTT
jgi:hypothetical protein